MTEFEFYCLLDPGAKRKTKTKHRYEFKTEFSSRLD